MLNRGAAIAVSWGKSGGFYWHCGYTIRLCLRRLAVTYLPEDLDALLRKLEAAAPPSLLEEREEPTIDGAMAPESETS